MKKKRVFLDHTLTTPMVNLTLGATVPIGPTISARLKDLLTKNNNDSNDLPTVEDYLSQENPPKFSGALGSGRAGQQLTTVPCANLKRQVPGSGPFVQCMSPGTLVCSQCLLVKYCSAECQKQHWKKHRKETCQSPLLDSESDDASQPQWVPAWFKEKRQPQFVGEQPESPVPRHLITNYNITLWGETPPVDLLNLEGNEGEVGRGYKICFARNQGGDIRNLVHTVNSLPEDFTGTLDILYHDQKTIQAGHTLLVLYALLNPELPIDEAAEFAVHLMYSAALTTPMAAYLYRCIHTIYGAFEGLDGNPFDDAHKGKTYDAKLPIRGGRTLEAVHEAWMLGLFLEQYVSDYKLKTAQRKMAKVMQNPKREDFAERFMVPLEGQHRVGITHFRKSGILLPFNVDAAHFDQPNRLMHGNMGEWFARHVAHPLSGWPVSHLRQSGLAHGALPTDIWGCFFFHVKSQFQEFARRVQKFNINITVATLPRDAIPQRIRDGKLGKAFQRGGGCFDRIDMGLIVDPHLRINDTLELWIPLLNKENPHAEMLMQINELAFHAETAAPNLSDLMITCSKALNLDLRRIGREGQTSPSLYRIMESVDAFHDNSDAFKTYFRGLGVERTAAALGVKARDVHRIHPQRHGVPVGSPEHTIPKLSSAEFYDLFTLGSADPATRYVEFGVVVKA